MILALASPAFAVQAVGNGNIPIPIPDSYLATTPLTQTCTTWVPTDTSGATLPITVNSANYCKTGKAALIQEDITYPVTSDSSQAMTSLPVTCVAANWIGVVNTNATVTGNYSAQASGTNLVFLNNPHGGGGAANVTLSTFNFRITIACGTT